MATSENYSGATTALILPVPTSSPPNEESLVSSRVPRPGDRVGDDSVEAEVKELAKFGLEEIKFPEILAPTVKGTRLSLLMLG